VGSAVPCPRKHNSLPEVTLTGDARMWSAQAGSGRCGGL